MDVALVCRSPFRGRDRASRYLVRQRVPKTPAFCLDPPSVGSALAEWGISAAWHFLSRRPLPVDIVDYEGMDMSALRRTGEMRVIGRQIVMAVDEVAGFL